NAIANQSKVPIVNPTTAVVAMRHDSTDDLFRSHGLGAYTWARVGEPVLHGGPTATDRPGHGRPLASTPPLRGAILKALATATRATEGRWRYGGRDETVEQRRDGRSSVAFNRPTLLRWL